MKRYCLYLVASLFAILSLLPAVRAADPAPELAMLQPFIGTWKTVSGAVDGAEGFSDVSKWEWILKGQVVRITHSVNDGAYAGESLIHWDGQQQKIIYRYVTTAGFYTDGEITAAGAGGIDVHEYVRGAASGPTETLAHYEVTADGRLEAWSKFLVDGTWTNPSTVTYEPAPGAEVKLP